MIYVAVKHRHKSSQALTQLAASISNEFKDFNHHFYTHVNANNWQFYPMWWIKNTRFIGYNYTILTHNVQVLVLGIVWQIWDFCSSLIGMAPPSAATS